MDEPVYITQEQLNASLAAFKTDITAVIDDYAKSSNASIEELQHAILPLPQGDLDESLVNDIIRQSVDAVSSLDALIEQNPAIADELHDARRSYQQARVFLQLALEEGETWKNTEKEDVQ